MFLNGELKDEDCRADEGDDEEASSACDESAKVDRKKTNDKQAILFRFSRSLLGSQSF